MADIRERRYLDHVAYQVRWRTAEGYSYKDFPTREAAAEFRAQANAAARDAKQARRIDSVGKTFANGAAFQSTRNVDEDDIALPAGKNREPLVLDIEAARRLFNRFGFSYTRPAVEEMAITGVLPFWPGPDGKKLFIRRIDLETLVRQTVKSKKFMTANAAPKEEGSL